MKHKQIAVITANSSQTFEMRANSLLSRLENPQIVFDQHKPLTIYVIYETEGNKQQ